MKDRVVDWQTTSKNNGPGTQLPAASVAEEYAIRIPLEERIEQTVILALSSNQYGEEEHTLTDSDVDLSLDALLDVIGGLLQRRPANKQNVDLLHLLAMMIHPYHAPESIPLLPQAFKKCPARLKAVRLMENATAGLQFQIHYGHRRQTVELVRDCLFLPELCDEYGVGNTALLAGALPHLQASLKVFVVASAQTLQDAHVALSAVASLAAQCKNYRLFLKPDWDFLLHRMLDDLTDYNCNGKSPAGDTSQRVDTATTTTTSTSTATPLESNAIPAAAETSIVLQNSGTFFCPHSSRGQLLSTFIERSMLLQRDSKTDFLTHVSTSLAEVIEWQVDCWTVHPEEEKVESDDNAKKQHPICLLASLLDAANPIFFLQTTMKKEDETPDDDDDPFVTLIRCAIQLLHHSDSGIVCTSAKLLVSAFSNENCNSVEKYSAPLLASLKSCFREHATASLVESLVALCSSRSPEFASSLYKLVVTKIETLDSEICHDQSDVAFYRLLVSISNNCPTISNCVKATTAKLIESSELTSASRTQTAVALVSSRLGSYFVDANVTTAVGNFLRRSSTSNWDRYVLARNAFVSGDVCDALDAIQLLLTCPLNEEHFVWLSLLEHVAAAEALLSKQGAMAIPKASESIHFAASYVEILESLSNEWSGCGSFHFRFLLLRLDFLDLTTVLRQLAREMRLSGSKLSKFTRSALHARNVVRGFTALAARYRDMGQQYGIYLRSRQSRHILELLRSLASFMAFAAKSLFSDVLDSRSSSKGLVDYFAVDSQHPIVSIMQKMDQLVLKHLTNTVDPIVRAAALLELIDAVLMVPQPFPRDFFTPVESISPKLLIVADPTRIYDTFDPNLAIIETSPSMGFSCYATGVVPNSLLRRLKVPTYIVLLWFRFKFISPLMDEEEIVNKEEDPPTNESVLSEIKMPSLSGVSPASSSISSSGHFFFSVDCPPLLEEGVYSLETKLGCRDVAGREWEMRSSFDSHSIPIKVSRSRTLV